MNKRSHGLDIRELGPSDYDKLCGFFERNNLPEVVRHFNPFGLDAKTAAQIVCGSHRDRYYGGFEAGELVGFCMLRGWDDGFTVPSFGVLVDVEFHGVGIGQSLTDFAIREASRLGCRQIRLSVFASNVAARRLYQSRGFTQDVTESVIVMGEQDEKIVMHKQL